MATVTLNKGRQFGSVPYGNVTSYKFRLQTGTGGALKNAGSTATIATSDEVILGTLPAGLTLEDAQLIVVTAMTGSSTVKLGFKYVDGTDADVALKEANDYFFNGQATSAAARVRLATTKLDVLPKDAYLVWTQGGATNVLASDITVIISGELTGNA